jgi:hypothetical protein
MQPSQAVGAVSDAMSREALISRIERLESLLVLAISRNEQPTAKAADHMPGPSLTSTLDIYGSPAFSGSRLQGNSEIAAYIDGMIGEFGCMKVDQVENSTIYLGGAHWLSIMSKVGNLLHPCAYVVDWVVDRGIANLFGG